MKVTFGARAYSIEIGTGMLPRADTFIAPLLKRKKTVIITDDHLADTPHLATLQKSLDEAQIVHDTLVIAAGEASKSFTQLEALCDWLLGAQIGRDDCIIALGGGVIGDLTGFATAILRRGTRFIQIPTSLLAQVDSSIGGKTAINSALGKNLIGAFHQPELVLADMDVLQTLPMRELRAGYAEIVKYGALGNAGFFNWLDENYEAVLTRSPAALAYAVAESCRAKAAIVTRDRREAGERALLNLGHSFAHAFEKLTGYGEALLHGEAVAYGMVLAFRFSVARGHCALADSERFEAHIRRVGLPVEMAQIGNDQMSDNVFHADALVAAMRQDKKVAAGQMRLILVNAIGESFIATDVDTDALHAFLLDEGAQA